MVFGDDDPYGAIRDAFCAGLRNVWGCAGRGVAQGVGGALVCWGARVWLLQADDSYHQGYGSDFGGGELEGVVVGVVGDDGDVVR